MLSLLLLDIALTIVWLGKILCAYNLLSLFRLGNSRMMGAKFTRRLMLTAFNGPRLLIRRQFDSHVERRNLFSMFLLLLGNNTLEREIRWGHTK